MDEQVKTIVEKLIEKTKRKGAIWQKNSGGDFDILFSGGTINVSLIYNDGDWDNGYYSMTIYNSRHERLCYYNTEGEQKDSEDFVLLENLYNNARGAYYKAEETYKSILDEIRNKNVVGIEVSNSLDDSSLSPF
jgi:hypothetical protein